MRYYKIIEGKKMDGRLIEIAQQATNNIGDGRISIKDAERF
jgi:hypothetical protein